MFDWQAEIAPRAALPKVARVAPPPLPVATPAVFFAHALKASTKDSSNDNLPQPLIRGETVGIKITQDIYEKGMAVGKRNLRGQLILKNGDKPYAIKEIQFKLHKL